MSAWVNVDMCTRRGKPLKVSRTFWEYQSTVSKLITRFCQSQEAPPPTPQKKRTKHTSTSVLLTTLLQNKIKAEIESEQ